MAPRSIAPFVVALVACGVTATHADVSERVEVDIRLRIDSSITSTRIIEGLKTETEAIWGAYGIRFDWTDAAAPEPAANGVSLDARLERRFEDRRRSEGPAVLGRVFVSHETLAWQPIRVSVDATEHVLARRATARASMPTGRVLNLELARALGRVLAHEIGHVLMGVADHDLAGLMRAEFRADELAAPDRKRFRLECSSVDRLRSRLRALNGDPQLFRRHESTGSDLEGESAGRASCITTR